MTRALVELSLAQGARLFDVTAVGRPEATELLQDQMETKLVRPLMDALGLAPAGRLQIEAIAALVVGAGFIRHRMEAPGLRPLDAGQLTELLTQPSRRFSTPLRDRPSGWPSTASQRHRRRPGLGSHTHTAMGDHEMKHTRLGDTGLRISRLALGCMSYGDPTHRRRPQVGVARR